MPPVVQLRGRVSGAVRKGGKGVLGGRRTAEWGRGGGRAKGASIAAGACEGTGCATRGLGGGLEEKVQVARNLGGSCAGSACWGAGTGGVG